MHNPTERTKAWSREAELDSRPRTLINIARKAFFFLFCPLRLLPHHETSTQDCRVGSPPRIVNCNRGEPRGADARWRLNGAGPLQQTYVALGRKRTDLERQSLSTPRLESLPRTRGNRVVSNRLLRCVVLDGRSDAFSALRDPSDPCVEPQHKVPEAVARPGTHPKPCDAVLIMCRAPRPRRKIGGARLDPRDQYSQPLNKQKKLNK
ncbi:hypothetical protein VUR80DRAFT_3685 [Thermomyces stellatus]